jgi:putative redox protein
VNEDTTAPKPHAPIDVEWLGGPLFESGRPGGAKARVDVSGETAPGPVDTLLCAVATCAATDVVTILEKQRTPAENLRVRVESTRVTSTPRRLASVVLHFSIRGRGIERAKAERAVALSVEKYCSVRSSLREDVPVTWTIDLGG